MTEYLTPGLTPEGAIYESARSAWTSCKRHLLNDLGEGYFRSYIEPLELALQRDDGALVFVAQNGTQALWVRENARDKIKARMDSLLSPPRRVAVCELRELSAWDRELLRGAREAAQPTCGRQIKTPWRGRFDTFCIGPANQKAVTLARQIAARRPAPRVVLFRGEPGVGKTHLVEAIANEAKAADPLREIRLINGQKFTEDFVEAVNRKKDPAAFKASVREADLLIIDDVPRVAGKKATEEELYDTMTAVLDRGGQVVLTAAIGSGPLIGFGDRLAHHLACAAECSLELPDEDLRRAILDSRVAFYAEEQPGFAVAPEALDMIAERMPVSGRELDGAIQQLIVDWLHVGAAVTLEVAELALRGKIADRERKVTVQQIKAAVAKHVGLSEADLMRKTREKAISEPRQMAMYLACKLTALSLPNIARLFGGYDHTTVLHARKKFAKLHAENPQIQRDIEAVLKILRQTN